MPKFTKKEIKKVSNLLYEAQRDLCVPEYVIHWSETKKRYKQKCKDKSKAERFAGTSVYPEYLEAYMTFNPRAVELYRDNHTRFLECLYHEVAHLVTNPMIGEKAGSDYHEQATERVGRTGYTIKYQRDANQ